MRQKHLLKISAAVILLIGMFACSPKSALTIEEHPIKSLDWEGEDLLFEPMEGTREEILATHANERNGQPITFTPPVKLSGDSLNVIENYDDNLVSVDVFRNDRLEMSIEAGVISPINNFRGIWVVDEQWFLEVAHVEQNPDDPNAAFIIWGEIWRDGESLIQTKGYDEAFNFQILNGKPFYFFSKAGEIGFYYDGQETTLGYTEIPHYQCCSGAAFNPQPAEKMVDFFASKGEQDYYVEIGAFE